MFKNTLTIVCAVVALSMTANVNAQDCGGCATAAHYGGHAIADASFNNCGREISNQGAASLWAGYCSETCGIPRKRGCRSGCGLGGGLGNKFGYPGGCCGNNGCFGYPGGGCGCGIGGGCGTGFGAGGGCLSGGGLFSKLKSGRGHGGCGGGCSLFGNRGGFDNSCGGPDLGCASGCGLSGFGFLSKLKSCGLLSKLKGRGANCGSCHSHPVTTAVIDQCGCGNNGQYFNYAVGAEYGTAGMQSSVSGVLTGACCN